MWCVVCGMCYVVCPNGNQKLYESECGNPNSAKLGGYLGKLHDSITKLQFSFSPLMEIRISKNPMWQSQSPWLDSMDSLAPCQWVQSQIWISP